MVDHLVGFHHPGVVEAVGDQLLGFQRGRLHQKQHVLGGSVVGEAVFHGGTATPVRIEIPRRPRNGVQRNAPGVEQGHGQRIEIQVGFPPPQQADDGHPAVLSHNLEGGAVCGPGIGSQDDQVDSGAAGDVVQLGFQVRVVVEEALVSPHPLGHLQAGGTVADGNQVRTEQRPQGHRSQTQRSQSDHRHVFAWLEMALR